MTSPTTGTIRIRDDFRVLIPPLRADELEHLEKNLLRDGCREPLVVWREDMVLLDGHHRHDLCRRHGIPFEIDEISLPDAEAAADWIDRNQLGRRNLSPDQMKLLRGRRYNRAKRQGARTDLTSGQSGQKFDAAEFLGREHGVSARTIRRDGEYALAVEKLKAADPSLDLERAGRMARPKRAIVEAAALWDESPERALAVLAGDKSLPAVKRELRWEALAQRLEGAGAGEGGVGSLEELVRGGRRFGTIYADPPWQYSNTSSRGAAENHYPTLSQEELRAQPVAELAADECHLHLWATAPLLQEALDLLEAWGFAYRSHFVWTKPGLGCGNYWRVSTELLLLGVRGSLPFADGSQRNWKELERGEHSAKPEEVRKILEQVSPGPRLELFGRRTAPGWTVWGNEVGLGERGGPATRATR